MPAYIKTKQWTKLAKYPSINKVIIKMNKHHNSYIAY